MPVCMSSELPHFSYGLCVMHFPDLGILMSEIARLNFEQLVQNSSNSFFSSRVMSARIFYYIRNTYARGSCAYITSRLTRYASLCSTHMLDVHKRWSGAVLVANQ